MEEAAVAQSQPLAISTVTIKMTDGSVSVLTIDSSDGIPVEVSMEILIIASNQHADATGHSSRSLPPETRSEAPTPTVSSFLTHGIECDDSTCSDITPSF